MINNNEDNPGNPSKRTRSKKSDIDHNESSALESQKKIISKLQAKKRQLQLKIWQLNFLKMKVTWMKCEKIL